MGNSVEKLKTPEQCRTYLKNIKNACDCFELIQKFPDKPWPFYELHEKLYFDKLFLLLKLLPTKNWNWPVIMNQYTGENLFKLVVAFPQQCENYYTLHTKIKGSNLIHILLKKYPHKNWNWSELHEYLTRKDLLDIVQTFPQKPLNVSLIQMYVNFNSILKNPQISWDYSHLHHLSSGELITLYQAHENFKLEHLYAIKHAFTFYTLVKKLKDEPWDIHQVVEKFKNDNKIFWNFFSTIPLTQWDWPRLQNIVSSAILSQLLVQYPFENWDWLHASQKMTLDYIIKYFNMPWNWSTVSLKIQTMSEIVPHSQLPWNWAILSRLMDKLKIIIHSDLPWHWDIVSKRMDLKHILRHSQLPWHWDIVSYKIDFKQALEHDKLPWNWEIICAQTDPPLAWVQEYPDKPWPLKFLVLCGQWTIIENHLDYYFDQFNDQLLTRVPDWFKIKLGYQEEGVIGEYNTNPSAPPIKGEYDDEGVVCE